MASPIAARTGEPDTAEPPVSTPQQPIALKLAPVSEVVNDTVTREDLLTVVDAIVRSNGLVGHNIRGANQLYERGLKYIISKLFSIDNSIENERVQTEEDQRHASTRIQITFNNVDIGMPEYMTIPVGTVQKLTPHLAKLHSLTYAAPLTMGATITLTAHFRDGTEKTIVAPCPTVQVSTFPIMVGSSRCHTSKCSVTALKAIKEDPHDEGGPLIVRGSEWVIELRDSVRFNSIHVHRAPRHGCAVQADIISQPGGTFENSSQLIVRRTTSGMITIEINSVKFPKKQIPFFLMFRLFGMTSDRDITRHVVYDLSDTGPVTSQMLDWLNTAFHTVDRSFQHLVAELDRVVIIGDIARRILDIVRNPVAYQADANAVRFLNTHLLKQLDVAILPHLGQGPQSRHRKLRFIGLMIRNMFLVEMRIANPTDRDTYRGKRVHDPGVSLAKAFKTLFNSTLVTQLRKAVNREVKGTPFSDITKEGLINIFRTQTSVCALDVEMARAIVMSDRGITGRHRALGGRISTQQLERKNQLNTLIAGRTIISQNTGNAAKQTARADEMRRVHPSYAGVVCILRSPDTGPKVGLVKELGITATVAQSHDPAPLIVSLLRDPAVHALADTSPEDIARHGWAKVFVNGDWIGCCDVGHALVSRYRRIRRGVEVATDSRKREFVHPYTTITWDPVIDLVEFWTDAGRLIRPLLIVDSNVDEYEAACRANKAGRSTGRGKNEFVQNIRLTQEHLHWLRQRKIGLQDLIEGGIMEMVTPEEQENCLICPAIDILRENRVNSVIRYTHCEIEQALFGQSALMVPLANHTQPVRGTYETNQGRSTCGWFAYNWPFVNQKNRIFQWYNETPIVRTIAHRYTPPNGRNVRVAYMGYGGDNQEDSCIVNEKSIHAGVYAGMFLRFERVELENGESFVTPDPHTTRNLKPNASYEKLVDGFVQPGQVVENGDVLIGRVARVQQRAGEEGGENDPGIEFVDRSIIYRYDEPATVDAVYKPRGEGGTLFALVKLRSERPLGVGDKMCLTPDHCVLVRRRPNGDRKPVWLPIAELTADDSVATLSSGEMVFERPSELMSYPLSADDDNMIALESDFVSAVMTPNHKMFVSIDGCRFEFVAANDVMEFATRGTPVTVLRGTERGDAVPHDITGGERDVRDAPAARWSRITCPGNVHCVAVPNHTFLVRRNGKIHWTGNSSRAGNKAICACIIPGSDMPYDEDGICPDIIINPHSCPTRMIIGQIIEAAMSMVGAAGGFTMDGTAFTSVDVKSIGDQLVKYGLRRNGRSRLFNGRTGEYFDAAIFVAPTYHQRLQKFIQDDRYAVDRRGPTDAITQQPLRGTRVRGGLRVSELQAWVLASHGASKIMYEKMMVDSDGTVDHMCCMCGQPAIFNDQRQTAYCTNCRGVANIVTIPTCVSARLLRHQLRACSIRTTHIFQPQVFEDPKVAYSFEAGGIVDSVGAERDVSEADGEDVSEADDEEDAT